MKEFIEGNFTSAKVQDITRLTGGISNENYKVNFSEAGHDTRDVVLTVYRGPEEQWKLRKEVGVRSVINGRSIPIPELLVVSESEDAGKPPYIVREYTEGSDLDDVLDSSSSVSHEDRRGLAMGMGAILGEMHTIEMPYFGYMHPREGSLDVDITEEKLGRTWREYFGGLLSEQVSRLEEANEGAAIGRSTIGTLKSRSEDIKEYFERNKSNLDSVTTPFLCHNDTRFGNFIVNQDGGAPSISSVIDFEWALAGDPDLDLVYIENWLSFAPYRKDVKDLIPEFLVGYEPHRRISSNYEAKRPLYHLYRSLSYLNAVYSQDLDSLRKSTPQVESYVALHMKLVENILDEKLDIPCAYTSWEERPEENPEMVIGTNPVNKLLAKHTAHAEKYDVTIGEIDLVIHPDVFCPAYTNTSVFLADHTDIAEGARVLDMFSGSGYQAIRAADRAAEVVAVDHSPKAIDCIQENIERHGLNKKVTALQGDLFSSIEQGEKFDIIIANPPLLPGVPRSLLETAVYDPGMQATRRFLSEAGNFLTEEGKVVLLFTDAGEQIGLGGLQFVESCIGVSGMKAEVVAEKPVGYETYSVIEIKNKK